MVGLLLNIGITKGLLNTIKYHMNAIIDSVGPENLVVIDIYKGNKLKNLLDRNDVAYRHIYWHDEYINWEDYIKDVKKSTKDLDSLIVFASNICKYNNYLCHSFIDGFEKWISDKNYNYSVNYVSTRAVLESYVICRENSNKNIIHFGLDPQECKLSDLFNGTTAYILNKNNMVYMPTYERYMFLNGKDIEKTLDFVFYGTAMNPDRQYLVDKASKIKKIKRSDVGIITKRDSTYVDQNTYYDKLAHAKFTLIIPSYDKTTFSIIRFLEAVSNHCLPLVLDNVDLTDLKNTFPDIYRIVKRYLVVDIDHIQDKINETDYDKIIKKIFNTESVKKFTDLEYFKKEWSKIV